MHYRRVLKSMNLKKQPLLQKPKEKQEGLPRHHQTFNEKKTKKP
jgi:hypothetical protein